MPVTKSLHTEEHYLWPQSNVISIEIKTDIGLLVRYKQSAALKIHRGLDTSTKTSGVTAYGINAAADAFDPLFHTKSKTEAKGMLQKMCLECTNKICPDFPLEIGACYSLIEHDI